MVHALNPDLGSLEEGEGGEVVHAIILPNYCEGMDTLETTLKVLASHPRAATQYEVSPMRLFFRTVRTDRDHQIFLAMEQKEAKAPEKAVSLISTFESQFRDICSTFHPAGLPGEIAGKSSNVAFAAHHIVEAHRSDETGDSRDIIITVMDGMSSPSGRLFSAETNQNVGGEQPTPICHRITLPRSAVFTGVTTRTPIDSTTVLRSSSTGIPTTCRL